MKVFEKFPFLLGLLASLFILLSLRVKSPHDVVNNELAIMGLIAAVVYWGWVVLAIRYSVKRGQYKLTFWLVIAVLAPFFGALLYQIMHERRNEIVQEEQRNEIAA